MERRLHDSAAEPGQQGRVQDEAGGVPARRHLCNLVWPSRCAANAMWHIRPPSTPLGGVQTADGFA